MDGSTGPLRFSWRPLNGRLISLLHVHPQYGRQVSVAACARVADRLGFSAMKTVVFAWELGRGLGHLIGMRRIARRLKANGIRLIAAVNDLAAADLLREEFGEIIAAPPWPLHSRPAEQRSAMSSATLNDILSAAGLADSAAVCRLLRAWDGIFKRTRPDLVVADFSPLAALAARGRIPLVLIGNGYTLPPHEMPRFPSLHRLSPPVWSEEKTLAAVNEAARRLRRTPLDRLPQIFSGDVCLVQTFPLLDPYDTQRTEPLQGPIFDRVPALRAAGASSIFVYMSTGYAPHPSVFEALRPFARRLRIHAPRLPAAQLDDLRRAGAQIDAEPVPLSDTLPATRLLAHNGGSGVAAEALVAGVPQLVLSAQVEQDRNGEALRRAGVARLVRTYEPGASVTCELINTMLNDDALATRAAELAKSHRSYLASKDALLSCERECLRLLAIS
jgi:UDP:flavonoid glycosyltransferase YjiC (YdhE family)